MEPNITVPEKKKTERRRRRRTNDPHMERHFVCVLLICAHALMLTAIALISSGLYILICIQGSMLKAKCYEFFIGMIILVITGIWSIAITGCMWYAKCKHRFSIIYITIALILLTGLLICTVILLQKEMNVLNDYHYRNRNEFDNLLRDSYASEDDVKYWQNLQESYNCVGIEDYTDDKHKMEHLQKLKQLNKELIDDNNIEYLLEKIHRGCSKQILYILERYNLLSEIFTFIHLSIVIIMLTFCLVYFGYRLLFQKEKPLPLQLQ